jgi:8-oxo-dGTP pyrophosphatase MutT (NUDIX family)
LGKYLKLKEKNGYEFVERKIGRNGAVVIIPFKIIDNKVLYQLIISKRETFGLPILEFPAGLIDREDEDIEEVAIRELEEETGWIGGNITARFWQQFSSPSSAGLSTELLYFVTIDITDAKKEKPNFDGNEKIAVCSLMSIFELFEYIESKGNKNFLVSSRLMTFLIGNFNWYLLESKIRRRK